MGRRGVTTFAFVVVLLVVVVCGHLFLVGGGRVGVCVCVTNVSGLLDLMFGFRSRRGRGYVVVCRCKLGSLCMVQQ